MTVRLRFGHGLAQPPTKVTLDWAEHGGETGEIVYYEGSCICGEAFVGPVKDHVWRQLAEHVVDSPGGLRELLKAAQN